MRRFLPTSAQKSLKDCWSTQNTTSQDQGPDPDANTDTQLALLSSLYPNCPQDTLLELLLDFQGSIPELRATLDFSHTRRASHQNALQTSVTSYLTETRKRSRTEGDAEDESQWSAVRSRGRKTIAISRNSLAIAKAVHLYTPTAIEHLTPCTFHPFFLPPDLANTLLTQLLHDSRSWGSNRFRLFNREVSSPHTTCFYVNPSRADAFQEEYKYYGASVGQTFPYSDVMIRVQKLVENVVNAELEQRGSKRHQYKGKWLAEVAFCNHYNGPSESVGYHSDTLTYLGPMPVIASLSLGVTREFRLRHLLSQEPTYSLHLPHNSLLVMHAPCQEEYKHCISPSRVVDSHPISGNSRINITYRMYRPCFAPSKSPICKCGVSMVLRCVSKQKDSIGRYFWSCSAAYQQQKGCNDFIWATFTDNGDPLPRTTAISTSQ